MADNPGKNTGKAPNAPSCYVMHIFPILLHVNKTLTIWKSEIITWPMKNVVVQGYNIVHFVRKVPNI
jgi:hypothetical protein